MWLLPAALLFMCWLPGANQGAYRVDTGLYSALGLHAWREGPLWPLMAGDSPYFNKPPLAILAHGALLDLLGTDLWVARLPSLLIAIIGVLTLRHVLRPMVGARAAMLAASTLALTLEYFRYTRAVSLDLWVTMFVIMAAAIVLPGARGPVSFTRIALAGVPIGLALLVKPLSPMLALPLFAAWLLPTATSGRERTSRGLALCAATVVAVGIAAAWYVPMYLRFEREFIEEHFTRQTLERATGETFGADPWWYYLRLIAETYWPWLAMVLLAGVAWWRGALKPMDRRAFVGASIWLAAWLLALSAFAGKSGRYAIVMYPALACIVGIALARHVPRPIVLVRRAAVRWLAPVGLMASVTVWLLGTRVHAPPTPHWREVYEFVRSRGEDVPLAAPGMMPTCANIYLSTGRWPATAGSEPSPGAIVLYRDEIEARPPANSAEVWRSGPVFAVRINALTDAVSPP